MSLPSVLQNNCSSSKSWQHQYAVCCRPNRTLNTGCSRMCISLAELQFAEARYYSAVGILAHMPFPTKSARTPLRDDSSEESLRTHPCPCVWLCSRKILWAPHKARRFLCAEYTVSRPQSPETKFSQEFMRIKILQHLMESVTY